VRNKVHIERLSQAKQLSADIADADRTERAADETNSHMIAAARKTCCRLARQFILDQ
jgi:hypothetical protein